MTNLLIYFAIFNRKDIAIKVSNKLLLLFNVDVAGNLMGIFSLPMVL